MKLLTAAILKKLPALYATDAVPADDKVLVVKFFTPDGQWTWYAAEFSPAEGRFFGYVEGLEGEWGYFSLAELESVRGGLGLPVERDMHWKPTTFGALKGFV